MSTVLQYVTYRFSISVTGILLCVLVRSFHETTCKIAFALFQVRPLWPLPSGFRGAKAFSADRRICATDNMVLNVGVSGIKVSVWTALFWFPREEVSCRTGDERQYVSDSNTSAYKTHKRVGDVQRLDSLPPSLFAKQPWDHCYLPIHHVLYIFISQLYKPVFAWVGIPTFPFYKNSPFPIPSYIQKL